MGPFTHQLCTVLNSAAGGIVVLLSPTLDRAAALTLPGEEAGILFADSSLSSGLLVVQVPGVCLRRLLSLYVPSFGSPLTFSPKEENPSLLVRLPRWAASPRLPRWELSCLWHSDFCTSSIGVRRTRIFHSRGYRSPFICNLCLVIPPIFVHPLSVG